MLSDKEKLEEELKLLKESLDLKVITEEEYSSAKARVDVKLKELEAPKETITSYKEIEEGTKENEKIDIKELKTDDVVQEKEQIKEETKEEDKKPAEEVTTTEEKTEEAKEEVKVEEKKPEEVIEDKEDTITLDFNWLKKIFGRKEEPVTVEPSEEAKIEEKPEEQKIFGEEKEGAKEVEEEKQEEVKAVEEKPEEDVKEEIKVTGEKSIEDGEEKPEVKEEVEAEEERPEELLKEEPAKQEEIAVGEIKSNKKLYGYIALIMILVAGIGYTLIPEKSDAPYVPTTPTIESEPSIGVIGKPNKGVIDKPSKATLIACSSDKECSKTGSIGTCKNPGKENAKCEYIDDTKVKLTILNSNDCLNCGTETLSRIKTFFPNLDIKNIDLDTEEGNELITKFGINVLPAYILNSSLKEAYNYDIFSAPFNEVNGNFIMKNTAANPKYYLNRDEIPNKLDLFVKQGHNASSKAEKNLKEFLEAFDGKVKFEKHNEDDEIVKELGLNKRIFPVFLVNNKIKFDGVQPADKIRQNFCWLNSAAECALGLSKSLV